MAKDIPKFTNLYLEDGVLKRNGKEAGWFDRSSGYRRVKYRGKDYLVHRIVFYLTHNYLPDIVDHIDQNKLNNHPDNLRDALYRGNNAVNSKLRADNSSGYRGVTWHKATNKWMSSIFFKGKRIHLGVFEDIIQAAKAYDEKAKELFGEFARINLEGNNIVKT